MKKLLILLVFLIPSICCFTEDNTSDIPPFTTGDIQQDKMNEELYYRQSQLETNATGFVTADDVHEIVHYDNIFFPQTTTEVETSTGSSYWIVDPVWGGLTVRDTSLVPISNTYWEIDPIYGGLRPK